MNQSEFKGKKEVQSKQPAGKHAQASLVQIYAIELVIGRGISVISLIG